MPDMREGGWGTAACYLTVERLALQAGVESPFWDGASLLMGGCEETWYKKPLTPRRLRSFIKRYGGSLPDDAGQLGQVASVFSDVMRIHGVPMEDGADDLGALYVRRAESVAMTVAFLATGCTLADMAAITGLCEEAVAERITRTWDGDAPGRIYGLAHAAYHDHIPETSRRGLDVSMSGMMRELHPLGLPRGIALPVDSRLRHVSTAHAMDNVGKWDSRFERRPT